MLRYMYVCPATTKERGQGIPVPCWPIFKPACEIVRVEPKGDRHMGIIETQR